MEINRWRSLALWAKYADSCCCCCSCFVSHLFVSKFGSIIVVICLSFYVIVFSWDVGRESRNGSRLSNSQVVSPSLDVLASKYTN